VEEISLMQHFPDADGPRGISAQLQAFDAVTHDLAGERSLSNSAAILRHGQALAGRSDWVRPGIVLYGSAPDFPEHSAFDWNLQPTMTLASKIIGVQQLAAGETVGYGSSFVAEAPMRVGIVACGYADGYPRHCPTGTPVLVNGVRTRLVGRVSMDMITVDLSPVPGAGIGSEATLWGRAARGALLPIDEVARAAGTVGYELMCAVAPRVPVGADGLVE
ncbi:MAG: alanine racemase, partial [Polaromonas sp.]